MRGRKARRQPAFRVASDARDPSRVALAGQLRLADAGALWRVLRQAARRARPPALVLDLHGVDEADAGALALLVEVRAELAARGLRADLEGVSERLAPLVALYEGDEHDEPGKPAKARRRRRASRRPAEGSLAWVGHRAVDVFDGAKEIVTFVGTLAVTALHVAKRPAAGHWKEITPLVERMGADAIPIVVLINFLVGFVMAFQAARQLTMFGANLYVADLVGIAHTRELAPLMTAIIVCGRSGAAIAAEIGSMKVAEEVDALRTLGLSPVAWLVIPRTLALLVVVPVLTLIADVVGVLGGLAVGISNLGLTSTGYLTEIKKSVVPFDVGTGIIKSVAFALAIALVASQQGFAASGGAEGVGKRTTTTVVTTLFVLVLIDTFFTMVFRSLDI